MTERRRIAAFMAASAESQPEQVASGAMREHVKVERPVERGTQSGDFCYFLAIFGCVLCALYSALYFSFVDC